MNIIIKSGLIAGALLAFTATNAIAEPIEGMWKRTNGTVLKYASAGGTKYCGTVMTGEYKGKSIGCMSGTSGKYNGKVIKLDEGKTYTGKASVSGNTMKLSGCVMKMLCKTEKLARQ